LSDANRQSIDAFKGASRLFSCARNLNVVGILLTEPAFGNIGLEQLDKALGVLEIQDLAFDETSKTDSHI